MKLEEIRKEIDKVDSQIAKLFIERMDLALEVAKTKEENKALRGILQAKIGTGNNNENRISRKAREYSKRHGHEPTQAKRIAG